jgi:sialic acid synthase SpsE
MAFICFIHYSIVPVVENGKVQLNNWVRLHRLKQAEMLSVDNLASQRPDLDCETKWFYPRASI